MPYIVQSSLKHDGQQYGPGDTLDGRVLNASQKARLLELGAIVDVKPTKPAKKAAKPEPAATDATG